MFHKGANLTSEFIYKDNELTEIKEGEDIFELCTLKALFESEFTLIEEEPEEIDIQGMKNLYIDCLFTDVDKAGNEYKIVEKIDELIKAAKQLDKKIGGNK